MKSTPIPFTTELQLKPGQTYIVDQVINLTSDLALPGGVTLIFQGGRFESTVPVTISAPKISKDPKSTLTPINGVCIQAPMTVIFGKNIAVTGHWITPFTSPLWFEAESMPINTQGSLHNDYAVPINKAIEMQTCGDVYLPKGDYYISEPIRITQGVTLCGDRGQLNRHFSTTIRPLGTKLSENREKDKLQYSHKYMIYVNPKQDEDWQYAEEWTALRDLSIENDPKVFPISRCVFARWAGAFERVQWLNFVQAVVFSNDYSDSKSVSNCIAEYSSELSKLI